MATDAFVQWSPFGFGQLFDGGQIHVGGADAQSGWADHVGIDDIEEERKVTGTNASPSSRPAG
jgi:hypothetical protein